MSPLSQGLFPDELETSDATPLRQPYCFGGALRLAVMTVSDSAGVSPRERGATPPSSVCDNRLSHGEGWDLENYFNCYFNIKSEYKNNII